VTASHYVEGVVLCALFIACVAGASICIRKRLLWAWVGAPARLAEVVIGISIVVLVSEALGSIGLFRVFPLVGTLAALSFLLLLSERTSNAHPTTTRGGIPHVSGIAPSRTEAKWEPVAAVLASGLVVAEWSAGTIQSLRNGVSGIDTFWYHMPFAAGFAQTGSVMALHNINNDNVIEFYPATSELLHAVGILLLGSDFLSPLANMAWLLFALFASWCLGRRYGVGSLSIVATAMVLGTTEVIGSEAGTSYNDVVGVALLLAAFGVLAYVDGLWSDAHGFQGLWVAALAAGLALGVKDTLIVPVAALTVGVIAMAPRGQRGRQGAVWCVVVLATGGYWYARNLVYAGNPLPNVHLGFGPIQLPTSPGTIGWTMSHFLADRRLWTLYFLPGLKRDLGPAWWALVVIALAGLIAGIVGIIRSLVHTGTRSGPVADPEVRSPNSLRARNAMAGLLALVGLATLFGYIVTPQPNLPESFVYDFRFTLLAFASGAIALPIALGRWRWVWVLLPAYGAVMVASQFAVGIWFGSSTLHSSVGEGLLMSVPIVIIGLGFLVAAHFGPQWLFRSALLLCILLVGVAIAVSFPLQTFYISHWEKQSPYPVLAKWASSVHHARIGVQAGILDYELYGSHLSNDVQFLAAPGPHGTWTDIATCAGWRRAINDGRIQFVVTDRDYARKIPPDITWTRTDPLAKLVVSEISLALDGFSQLSVYAINGTMSTSGCPHG
jgi:hypothetical protein